MRCQINNKDVYDTIALHNGENKSNISIETYDQNHVMRRLNQFFYLNKDMRL